MEKIIKVVEGILAKDPEYVEVVENFNPTMNRYIKMFTFGKNTQDAIFDLEFECQSCGNCCLQPSDLFGVNGCCPSLKNNECEIYRTNNYPVQCETYPFMLPTIAVVTKGIGFRYADFSRTNFTYEFGILDDLGLVIGDYDKGWLNGKKKIGGHFEDVKKTILNSDERVLIPKWGNDKLFNSCDAHYLEHLKKVKEQLLKSA